MKLFVLYFMLLVTSSSCASSSIQNPGTIKSWNTVDPKPLNDRIRAAYASGQAWASQPQLYVFNLFYFEEIKSITYDYEVDNTENPQHITIRLIRDGFLDDAVRGDIQRIELNRNKQGEWEIILLQKAHRCWRGEEQTFTTEPCP